MRLTFNCKRWGRAKLLNCGQRLCWTAGKNAAQLWRVKASGESFNAHWCRLPLHASIIFNGNYADALFEKKKWRICKDLWLAHASPHLVPGSLPNPKIGLSC